jgi:hypothetical protein
MEMTLRDRRVGLFVLVVMAFVPLAGMAQMPLNPLVIRNEEVRVAVPSECEEGLSATPALRVNVSEIPLPPVEPRASLAPPTDALRGALHETQTALARNNRPAFDEARARLHAVVETYPTGGERRAAEQLVRIYDAAARLWDAQYTAPFFGEDSAEYALANEHPGYAEAVRRATFTDSTGRRFYPAAESREFLAGVAAQRLQRLGVSAPAPSRRTTPGSTSSVARATPRKTSSPRVTAPTNRPSSGTRRSSTTGSTSGRRRTASSGISGTSATSGSSSRSSSRKPAAVTHTPSSSPNPSAPPTSAAVPAPAPPRVAEAAPATATSPAAGDDVPATTTRTLEEDLPPAVTGDTMAGDTAASPPPAPTTSPAATGTTETAPGEPETPSRTRSVVLPMILILIGLGVLIVLFRASK